MSGYDFPQRLSGPDAVGRERRRLRRSMRTAWRHNDVAALRYLAARVERLHAATRWRPADEEEQ